MSSPTLREKVATAINNRYYVPPGVMAEMVDAILALYAEDRRELVELLRCALPNRAMLDEDRQRAWYHDRDAWLAGAVKEEEG